MDDHRSEGFEETMTFEMFGYVVPLDQYPNNYNGEPLSVVAQLDTRKSCVRFPRFDDVARDVLGDAGARVMPEDLIAAREAVHPRR